MRFFSVSFDNINCINLIENETVVLEIQCQSSSSMKSDIDTMLTTAGKDPVTDDELNIIRSEIDKIIQIQEKLKETQ